LGLPWLPIAAISSAPRGSHGGRFGGVWDLRFNCPEPRHYVQSVPLFFKGFFKVVLAGLWINRLLDRREQRQREHEAEEARRYLDRY
jgi:hypothetical protein